MTGGYSQYARVLRAVAQEKISEISWGHKEDHRDHFEGEGQCLSER